VTRIPPESGEHDAQADAGVGTFSTAPQQGRTTAIRFTEN